MNLTDERLLDAAVEGKLSRAHHALFNEKFHTDPVFREAYFRQSEVDSLLRLRLTHEAAQKETTVQFRTGRRVYYYVAGAIAASVALLCAGAMYHFSGYKKDAPAVVAAKPETVRSSAINGLTLGSAGRVVRSLNADVSGPFGKIDSGSLLMPGLYTVQSGSLSLELDSGAILHVDAPAKIEIETPFFAVLREGNVTAVVPEPAIGFVLKTPTARIEDFGTSFAVNVAPAGGTKMRVLEGEVEIASLQMKSAPEKMFANAACEVVDPAGDVRPIAAASVDVPDPLPHPAGTPAKYVRWTFDDLDAAGNFIDTGTHSGNAGYTLSFENTDGSASGIVAGRTQNAWNFDGKRCALVSNYPGIEKNTPRTVAFWVKIPADALPSNAYSIIAWGIPQLPSRKWQLACNVGNYPGEGKPGPIRTEFGRGFVVGSTDLRDGQWHHVVSVFLGEQAGDVAESIRHYVDGRLEAVTAYKSQKIATETVETHRKAKPLKLGQRLENDPKSFPAFKGTLDDVYIFDGALTPEQIYELYTKNTPPAVIYP